MRFFDKIERGIMMRSWHLPYRRHGLTGDLHTAFFPLALIAGCWIWLCQFSRHAWRPIFANPWDAYSQGSDDGRKYALEPLGDLIPDERTGEWIPFVGRIKKCTDGSVMVMVDELLGTLEEE